MTITLIKLYTALIITFFLPGYFLMLAVFGKTKNKLSAIEKLVITFSLSIISVDLLTLLMNYFSIPITRKWILLIIVAFSMSCYGLYKSTKKSQPASQQASKQINFNQLTNFSYRQILIFILVLALAISIRGFYVSRGVMPQTTDMGHHMYWANHINTTATLPDYDGAPDFIIGEHIPFATIAALTRIPYVSAMPVTILLLIGIFSLLANYILTFHLTKPLLGKSSAKNIALFSLLILGSFYAISSPSAKFISGGVVGNTIGNLFIPLAIYAFIRTIQTKKWPFAFLFVLTGVGLTYTHHLSSFVFLYVLLGFFALAISPLLITHHFNIKKTVFCLLENLKPFISWQNIALFLTFLLFIFFVRTPSYLNSEAIDTAVGTPIKATRTGMTVGNVLLSVGTWRFLFGSIGLAIIGFLSVKLFKKSSKKSTAKIVSFSFMIAWALMIFLMATKPALLKIDIPSGRIVSYLIFPFTVLSATALYLIYKTARKKIKRELVLLAMLVILGTGFISGFSDISESARGDGNNKDVFQTYAASIYLTDKTTASEQIIKDHINMEADVWIKIFFMRGYKYPLSRTYAKRYVDIAKNRETCTRDMIAIPDSEIAKECFSQTGTKYVMLKPGFDTAQFENSENFQKVYTSDSVVIFQRSDKQP